MKEELTDSTHPLAVSFFPEVIPKDNVNEYSFGLKQFSQSPPRC